MASNGYSRNARYLLIMVGILSLSDRISARVTYECMNDYVDHFSVTVGQNDTTHIETNWYFHNNDSICDLLLCNYKCP